MLLSDKSAFHIHTYRCGHAENISDEKYIQKAIRMGADSIWFSDHAPFPGDPFGSRMKYDQLYEYLDTLINLKEKYGDYVHIGLETEYFPSFDEEGYYKKLRDDKRIEFLLLGQHMAEDPVSGGYTFSWSKNRLEQEEFIALGKAICQGIDSGYFDFVAHPDRIYRHCKEWTLQMAEVGNRIISKAKICGIPLEINMSSIAGNNYYWPEFWQMNSSDTITGLDAHSTDEMEREYERLTNLDMDESRNRNIQFVEIR